MADPNEPELPPIAEGRRSPRKRVILGGKIVYNEGIYTYDCRMAICPRAAPGSSWLRASLFQPMLC